MNEIYERKELTVKQIVNFINAIKKGRPENMTLSELIIKCFNDNMMFDSWFNHINVME